MSSNQPPHDASGATVWEIREMARDLENKRAQKNRINIDSPVQIAILVEALRCLADRKEGERK